MIGLTGFDVYVFFLLAFMTGLVAGIGLAYEWYLLRKGVFKNGSKKKNF